MFTAGKTSGRMSIEVAAAGNRPYRAASAVIVRDGVAEPVRSEVPLSLLAASHRGIDVTPERLEVLERFVRATISAPDAAAVTRPLRSSWWLVPFCGCLSAEWWIRRRRGHR